MPQLSLYIDAETLQKIEKSAKMNKTSVSKFVSAALKEYFSKNWPEGYQDVFGSVMDDSFTKPEAGDFSLDTKREGL